MATETLPIETRSAFKATVRRIRENVAAMDRHETGSRHRDFLASSALKSADRVILTLAESDADWLAQSAESVRWDVLAAELDSIRADFSGKLDEDTRADIAGGWSALADEIAAARTSAIREAQERRLAIGRRMVAEALAAGEVPKLDVIRKAARAEAEGSPAVKASGTQKARRSPRTVK